MDWREERDTYYLKTYGMEREEYILNREVKYWQGNINYYTRRYSKLIQECMEHLDKAREELKEYKKNKKED